MKEVVKMSAFAYSPQSALSALSALDQGDFRGMMENVILRGDETKEELYEGYTKIGVVEISFLQKSRAETVAITRKAMEKQLDELKRKYLEARMTLEDSLSKLDALTYEP